MKKLNKDERFTMGALFYIMILTGIDALTIGAVVPHLRAEYGLSYETSGFLMSANSAGVLVMSLVASYTAMIFGLKQAYCAQHAFIIVGLVVISITGNPLLLMVGMAFLGMGRGSTVNYNFQIANDVTRSNPSLLGFANAFFAIGACTVPFLVIVCVNTLGNWRYAALSIGIATAIGIILSMRMKIERADSKSNDAKIGGYAFLKSKKYWLINIMIFFYIGMETSVGGWIIPHFMETHNATNQFASSMVTVFWATMLVGRVVFSILANKLKVSTLILCLCLGMAVFTALFVGIGGLGFAIAAAVGLGMFMSGFYSAAISSAGYFFSTYKVALGVFVTVGGFGAVIFPALVGIVAERQRVQVGLIIIAVAALALLTLAIFNKRMEKNQTED